MREITHQQLRDDIDEVLRRVAGGEAILITDRGRPTALISPPPTAISAQTAPAGGLRQARSSPATLRMIHRRASAKTTSQLLADVRGCG